MTKMLKDCETDNLGLPLSVTITEKFAGFGGVGPVGVPVIVPVEFKCNPAGNAPAATAKVSGGTPPVTCTV